MVSVNTYFLAETLFTHAARRRTTLQGIKLRRDPPPDPRIVLDQRDVWTPASATIPCACRANSLDSKALPRVNSPTRFNNHGVTSFPRLSTPCSIDSRTACSTAS